MKTQGRLAAKQYGAPDQHRQQSKPLAGAAGAAEQQAQDRAAAPGTASAPFSGVITTTSQLGQIHQEH
jgi:hypothetical protein